MIKFIVVVGKPNGDVEYFGPFDHKDVADAFLQGVHQACEARELSWRVHIAPLVTVMTER